MELKKVNDDIFILGDRIDIMKEHMTDGEYMESMNSLSKLKNSFDSIKDFMSNVAEFMSNNHNFNYDITNTPFSIYMNSLNDYIYLRSKIRVILTNKLHKFRIDNNLPLDFMKSKFNLIDFICDLDYNVLKKNYVIQNNKIICQCDNSEKNSFCCNSVNDFIHCGHLQDIILHYPLLLVICIDKPIDEIVVDIPVSDELFFHTIEWRRFDNRVVLHKIVDDFDFSFDFEDFTEDVQLSIYTFLVRNFLG